MADFVEPEAKPEINSVPQIASFKEISIGAGGSQLKFAKGRLEIYDSSGNLVILMDPNA